MVELASLSAPKSWSLEPSGRLVHLRWAVAELTIGIETPSAGLDAAARALSVFARRASALLEALADENEALSDACYTAQLGIADARTSLAHPAQLRVERARVLHQARRKLHRALIIVAEAMAREGGARLARTSGVDSPELSSLLELRQMFSAFRCCLISAGEQRARLSWALEVAGAELSVLMSSPLLFDLPARSQQLISDLARRVTDWGLREPDPVLGRSLYREVAMIPAIAIELSSHPLLVGHDDRALSELSALLSHEPTGTLLEAKVLGHLSALRGYDVELDGLELNLIYGAGGALVKVTTRVADLRSRIAPSARQAASWS